MAPKASRTPSMAPSMVALKFLILGCATAASTARSVLLLSEFGQRFSIQLIVQLIVPFTVQSIILLSTILTTGCAPAASASHSALLLSIFGTASFIIHILPSYLLVQRPRPPVPAGELYASYKIGEGDFIDYIIDEGGSSSPSRSPIFIYSPLIEIDSRVHHPLPVPFPLRSIRNICDNYKSYKSF